MLAKILKKLASHVGNLYVIIIRLKQPFYVYLAMLLQSKYISWFCRRVTFAFSSPAKSVATLGILVTVWMISGVLIPSRPQHQMMVKGQTQKVLTQYFSGQHKVIYAKVDAVIEPVAVTSIKTKIEAKVLAVNLVGGEFVKAGEVIAQLDSGGCREHLRKAELDLQQARINVQGKQALFAKGLSSKAELMKAKAELERQQANFINAQYDLENTSVQAPFSGYLEHIKIKTGDFASKGIVVAELIDPENMLAIANVGAVLLNHILNKETAYVYTVDGKKIGAQVKLIGQSADNVTRTFRVELKFHNPHLALRAGEMTSVDLPIYNGLVHKIPSMLLKVDDSGELKVKVVTARGVVASCLVHIIQSEADGVWVRGLPQEVELIVVGQDFLENGMAISQAAATN